MQIILINSTISFQPYTHKGGSDTTDYHDYHQHNFHCHMIQHDDYHAALQSLDHLSHSFLVKHCSIVIMIIITIIKIIIIIIINFIVNNVNHCHDHHPHYYLLAAIYM